MPRPPTVASGGLCCPGLLSPSCGRVSHQVQSQTRPAQLLCFSAGQTTASFPKRPFTRVCSLQSGTWLCPAWQSVTEATDGFASQSSLSAQGPCLSRLLATLSALHLQATEGLGLSCMEARPSLQLGRASGGSSGHTDRMCAFGEEHARNRTSTWSLTHSLTREPPHLGPYPFSHLHLCIFLPQKFPSSYLHCLPRWLSQLNSEPLASLLE